MYTEPVLNSREECNAFEDRLFFRSYLPFERFLSTIERVLFAARFTLKTALNSHEECNEFADLLFQRPSLWIILPSERLFNFSRAARSLSLYFYTSYTFLPILELFTHFSYTNLSDVYYRAECFYYPWLCRWSAKARSLILIFSFISQRPHLNYILLSNIYSFEFP